DLRSPGHERTLGLERQQAGSLIEADPADPIELVIMALQIAADWLHEAIVDGLVASRPPLDEPVPDGPQNARGPALETGLLRQPGRCRAEGAGAAEAQSPLARFRRRADEPRGLAGRIPCGDAALHGRQWYLVRDALQAARQAWIAGFPRLPVSGCPARGRSRFRARRGPGTGGSRRERARAGWPDG